MVERGVESGVATPLPGSFRDPAGHVFLRDGIVHRQIDPPGAAAYRRLMESGLYAALTGERLLVAHEELAAEARPPGAVAVLRPQQIPMVSYPYEWSLSQLRDAALATRMAEEMLAEGVYVIGFCYPVVPQGKARIRTQVSAAHSRADLEQAVAAFSAVRTRLG